jgi:hypothetical protein
MGFEVVRQQDTEWLQCGAMLAQSRLEMDGASAKHLPVGGACQRVAQTTHDSLETSPDGCRSQPARLSSYALVGGHVGWPTLVMQ